MAKNWEWPDFSGASAKARVLLGERKPHPLRRAASWINRLWQSLAGLRVQRYLRPNFHICVVGKVQVDAAAAPVGVDAVIDTLDIVGDEVLA